LGCTIVFRSDGTDANTVLLKDCFTGPNSSLPSNFTKISNYVYFSAFGGPEPDWKGGTELWRTDGTTAGTVFIKDVNNSHVSSNPRNFKGYNNEAYFVATAGLADQIYKTNGTVGNTSYITDVSDDDFEILQEFLVYKKYSLAASKMEIWTKNLTSGVETKVFTPAYTGSNNVQILFNAGSYVIFSADDHLYSYNGTATTKILDTEFTAMFTSVSGVVYFMARFGNDEERIYKTNGPAAGTLLVKSFLNPLTELHSLTNVNGTLYFAINIPAGNNYAGDQIINGYLYKSDGTEAGTVIVRTYADPNKKLGIMMNSLTAGVGNELFYVVEQTILLDPNLIMSDNVPKNTLIVDKLTTAPDAVRDIIKVGYNSVLPKMSKSVLVNNHLFFAFNDRKESKGGFGNELWAYRRDCPGNVLVNRATPPDIGRTFNSANIITSYSKIFANETVMDGAPRYDKERFPVTFRATTSVTLLPGFEASTNKVFKAEIGGCN
jgi:ELWxxDGT repeat protein